MKVKFILGLFFALTLSFGCKKESTLEFDIPGPEANFDISYGTEGEVTFTNTSKRAVSFEWDFGDGNTLTSNLVTVSNTYENKGTYSVTLTAKDDEGESNSITKEVTTSSEPWKPKIYKTARISKFEVFRHPTANPAMELLRNQTRVVTGPPGGLRSANIGMTWSTNPFYTVTNLNDNYTFRLLHFQQSENRYYLIADLPIKFTNYNVQKHPGWVPPNRILLENADGTAVVFVYLEWFE